MNIYKHITRLILAASLILPGMVNAAVALPALDIQNLTGDAGASFVALSSFDIDATAFTIITESDPVDISNVAFTLTSTYNAGSGFFEGSFLVDGGSLLSGTFSNLMVIDIGAGSLQYLGDVSYTGGSLAGGLTDGRFEGGASGINVVAKLGAVVPVPAAVWLFGSGILGLVAVARRKKDIQ